MKANRLLILCATALLMPLAALAQTAHNPEVKRDTTLHTNGDTLITITYEVDQRRDTISDGSEKPHIISNDLRNNFFASARVGAMKYWGEDDNQHGFLANLTPTASLSFGKWLYPFVGLRVNLGFQQAKGYTPGHRVAQCNYITGEKDSKGLYKQEWSFWSYGLDLLLNLSDLTSYNPQRKNLYTLTAGWSSNQSLKTPANEEAKSSAAFTFGVEYRRRLKRNWEFVAAAQTNIYNKSFDDEQTPRYFECAPQLTVGLTYNINTRKSKNVIWDTNSNTSVNTYLTYMEVKELHKLSITTEDKDYIHPVAVFFIINKWDIRPEYLFTLEQVANEIKRTKAKFILFGSADSATGNVEINRKLAINRCASVFDTLTGTFGVDPNQLEQRPLGGVDTYNTKHLNRCVIVVQNDAKAIQVIKDLNEEKKF